jgi:hypothetical protein
MLPESAGQGKHGFPNGKAGAWLPHSKRRSALPGWRKPVAGATREVFLGATTGA